MSLESPEPEVTARIYGELRAMAARYLRREASGHTLQPTALVHEAWLRLEGVEAVEGVGRARFLSMAARSMRTILIDHARGKQREKRGGGAVRVTLQEVEDGLAQDNVDLLDLDGKLTELGQLDERKARIVELRFFAGLTVKQVAEVLGLHFRTIEADWLAARIWLAAALSA